MFVINECIKYGINTDDFLDTSYKSNKWKKWLFKINKSNRFKCSILSGHYNFYHKSYKNMVDQLRKIDPEIDNKIINSNYDIIDHYVKNFY